MRIEVNGRIRDVRVEPVGGGFRVTLDGRVRVVDLAMSSDGMLSLIFPEEGRRSHEIAVGRGTTANTFVVQVGGAIVPVASDGTSARSPSARAGAPVVASGAQRIVAPMPGKIVRVLVAAGDHVRARQAVAVVEAMKMENELRSPRDGVVTDLPAIEGASVEAGALLAVVE